MACSCQNCQSENFQIKWGEMTSNGVSFMKVSVIINLIFNWSIFKLNMFIEIDVSRE